MQQMRDSIGHAPHIVCIHKPAVESVLDNFSNSLPAASNHGLLGGHHPFEIDTAQSFVATGKSKQGAVSHGLGDLPSTLTSKKTHLARDV